MMALEIRPAAPAAPAVEVARTERAAEAGAAKETDPRAVAELLVRDIEAQVAAAEQRRQKEQRELAGENSIRQTRLRISVGDDGALQVKVLDARTDKVVRTIPPDELVEFARKLKRYNGLILDRRG